MSTKGARALGSDALLRDPAFLRLWIAGTALVLRCLGTETMVASTSCPDMAR